MATYRSIHTTFWTDAKIHDSFQWLDKYFMLYCLTNNHTNLCGCYEVSLKQISDEMVLPRKKIILLIEKFEREYNMVFYNKDNKELYIKNWHKYNWTKSNKLDKPLLNEILNVKTEKFRNELIEKYNKRDTVSIPYTYGMDTTVLYCTVSDTDKNKQFNFEKEKKDVKNLYEN